MEQKKKLKKKKEINITKYVNNIFLNNNCLWIPKNTNLDWITKKDYIFYYKLKDKIIYIDKYVKSHIILDLNNPPNYSLKNNSIILLAFSRNENNVVEWLSYNKLIGFDYIFIVDHLSDNPIKNYIAKFKNVFLYTINNINAGFFEMPSCKGALNCLFEIMKSTNNIIWGSRFDLDEYLALYNFENIHKFIEKYKDYDILDIEWLMFGSNYHDKPTGNLIIEDFTKCTNYENLQKWYNRHNMSINLKFDDYKKILVKAIIKNNSYITNKKLKTHAHTLNIKNKILIESEKIHHYVHRYYQNHINRYNIRQNMYHYESKEEYDKYFNNIENTYLKDKYSENIKKQIAELPEK